MARWVAFNALQMHSHVQAEIGRRRVIEANPLPAEEYTAWEAKIRHELRADAVFALTFNPQRALKAEQDRRSGAEPTTAAGRAQTDTMLLALAPEWEAARDAYAEASQRCSAISAAAYGIEPTPSPDLPFEERQRAVQGWRERTGVEDAEGDVDEALDALGAIEDRIPERPAALLFRASDHPLRLGKYLTHPDHLEGNEVTAEDVAWMKRKPYVREIRRPVRPDDNLPPGARTVVDTSPWPEAQERADEIVTAWDAWHAEKLWIHGEYVTEALDDAANAASDVATDLAMRIAALPAHTAAGLRVKLKALACYNPSFFYLNPPEFADPHQALAYSLGRDMRA